MRKSIAAILTAMAMVFALVLPMTAFADNGADVNKSAKTYDESFKATKDEPSYDVVVEEDVDVEEPDEDATLIVDVDDDDVSLLDQAAAKANELSAKIKAIDIDLPDGEFDIDYEKLYFNMLKADAEYLYTLEEWLNVYDEDKEILPTKWVNVDGIKGKLPVFDLPILAWGAAKTFDLYNKNGDVETYNLGVKKYDPNFTAPDLDVDLTAEGEKVLNYVDSNNGAHHVLTPSETRVASESKVKLAAPIAVLAGEAVAAAGLLFAGLRRKNND